MDLGAIEAVVQGWSLLDGDDSAGTSLNASDLSLDHIFLMWLEWFHPNLRRRGAARWMELEGGFAAVGVRPARETSTGRLRRDRCNLFSGFGPIGNNSGIWAFAWVWVMARTWVGAMVMSYLYFVYCYFIFLRCDFMSQIIPYLFSVGQNWLCAGL